MEKSSVSEAPSSERESWLPERETPEREEKLVEEVKFSVMVVAA